MIKLTFNTVTIHRPERFGVCAALWPIKITSYKLTVVEISVFGRILYSKTHKSASYERIR